MSNSLWSYGRSPPGSSVHGILQARILKWITISFSKGSSQPREWTQVSLIARQILYLLSHQGSIEQLHFHFRASLVAQKIKHLPAMWETWIWWRRKWQPIPVLLPGISHGWRSLVGYSPWGRKVSDMTEQLHFYQNACWIKQLKEEVIE